MSDIQTNQIAPPVQASWIKRRLKFFTKKRLKWIIPLTIVVVIGVIKFSSSGTAVEIQTETVRLQNIEQTVLSTGQVTSNVDLDLSFTTSGKVTHVYVKEGDVVKAGKVLATLNQDSARASLTSAAGAVAQAKANYEKVLSGSTDTQVQVSQAAVDAAQTTLDNANRTYQQTVTQQAASVESARRTMMNTGLAAEPTSTTGSNSTAPIITGTYKSTAEGTYTINMYHGGGGLYYRVTGMEVSSGPLITSMPVPLGTRGLYMQFSSTAVYDELAQWTVTIPNTNASTYLTYKNAYDIAIQTEAQALASAQNTVDSARASLAQAEANLQQTLSQASSSEINAAKAQITSAQGQYLAAQAVYNTTIITAPMKGTITSVNIHVGELATAMSTALILQNVDELHAEVNVSEANVASLVVGQSVDYTFDALGPDRHFTGVIETINPASTVVSGVVNYKVTANILDAPEIKPGMTANITVNVASKENVIAIPARAVIEENGKDVVRVITDTKKQTYESVPVTTGIRADGGLIEILSGLTDGQEIVTFIR